MNSRTSAIILSFLLSTVSCLLSAANLSGVVRDQVGNPIVGADVRLFEVVSSGSFFQVGDAVTVGSDGAYSWDITPGVYVLRTNISAADLALQGAPDGASINTEDFVFRINSPRVNLKLSCITLMEQFIHVGHFLSETRHFLKMKVFL